MNTFEDLIRRDLQTAGTREAFDVDIDPVLEQGHRTLRRRVLVPLAAAAALLVGATASALALRPWERPATPIASPTAPAPVLDAARYGAFAQFASPSTRVACSLGPEGVVCNIPMDYAGTLPPTDEACEPGLEAVNDVLLTESGPVVYGCGTDPASMPYRYNDATAWMESGLGTWVTSEYFGGEEVAVLPAGSTLEIGNYRCTAEDDAITCGNTVTDHWMRVAPEGITEG